MKNRFKQRKTTPAEDCLLVYDEGCQLCVGTKHKLERAGLGQAGSEVRFVPYDSDEAKQALGARYVPGRPHAAFLVRPTGEVAEGLEAFIPLLPRLSGGRILLFFLRVPVIKRGAEVLYRVLAGHRYRLFGKAHPTRPLV